MANLMLFSGGSNTALAQRVADELRLGLGRADVGRFSDGEVSVEVHENVRGQDVFLLQSTCAPTNDSVMELLIMADAISSCFSDPHYRSDTLLRLRAPRPPATICSRGDKRQGSSRYDQQCRH